MISSISYFYRPDLYENVDFDFMLADCFVKSISGNNINSNLTYRFDYYLDNFKSGNIVWNNLNNRVLIYIDFIFTFGTAMDTIRTKFRDVFNFNDIPNETFRDVLTTIIKNRETSFKCDWGESPKLQNWVNDILNIMKSKIEDDSEKEIYDSTIAFITLCGFNIFDDSNEIKKREEANTYLRKDGYNILTDKRLSLLDYVDPYDSLSVIDTDGVSGSLNTYKCYRSKLTKRRTQMLHDKYPILLMYGTTFDSEKHGGVDFYNLNKMIKTDLLKGNVTFDDIISFVNIFKDKILDADLAIMKYVADGYTYRFLRFGDAKIDLTEKANDLYVNMFKNEITRNAYDAGVNTFLTIGCSNYSPDQLTPNFSKFHKTSIISLDSGIKYIVDKYIKILNVIINLDVEFPDTLKTAISDAYEKIKSTIYYKLLSLKNEQEIPSLINDFMNSTNSHTSELVKHIVNSLAFSVTSYSMLSVEKILYQIAFETMSNTKPMLKHYDGLRSTADTDYTVINHYMDSCSDIYYTDIPISLKYIESEEPHICHSISKDFRIVIQSIPELYNADRTRIALDNIEKFCNK